MQIQGGPIQSSQKNDPQLLLQRHFLKDFKRRNNPKCYERAQVGPQN